MKLTDVVERCARSAGEEDEMLPDYRLHRITHWVQKVFFFFTARRRWMDIWFHSFL